MRQNRFKPPKTGVSSELKLGRMVLVSLGLHLVVFLLFSGLLLPRMERERRPVYYVDLVNLPVESPQAGRPDARKAAPKEAKKELKKEPKPAVAKKNPPPSPKKSAPAVVKKHAPAEKVVKKKVQAPEENYGDALSAIEELQRKKEIEDLRKKIAALGQEDTRRAPTDAPVGMAEGTGDQAGTSFDAWLHEYLKRAWTLSRYQVTRQDLEATVRLVFNRQGRLVDYRFIEESGEKRFDDSVKKAVLQLKELPNPPDRRLEVDVVFNLKDLLE